MKYFHNHRLDFISLALCLPLYICFKKHNPTQFICPLFLRLNCAWWALRLIVTITNSRYFASNGSSVLLRHPVYFLWLLSLFQLSGITTISFLYFSQTNNIPLPMSLSEHHLMENSSQIFLNFFPLCFYCTLPHSFFLLPWHKSNEIFVLLNKVNGLHPCSSAVSAPSITLAVCCVVSIASD